MAAVTKNWKRLVAVGCTHGDCIQPSMRRFVLDFCQNYSPKFRVDLGDLIDTASFRAGAGGTADEGRSIYPDLEAAKSWITDYKPTHITWGNHDQRLWDSLVHPNAKIRFAAQEIITDLESVVDKVKAKTYPYTIGENHFKLGGHTFLHGFIYSANALRDTAYTHCSQVVMAHLHSPKQEAIPMVEEGDSFCVGTLSDRAAMTYAHRRHKTLSWGHGLVFGEVAETKTGGQSRLWLLKSRDGELPQIPFNIK